MQDTTAPIPKEVVITCGLFLVILVFGTLAFDMYTEHDNTLILTSAAVAENGIVNVSNKITGGIIGITGAATADSGISTTQDKQIGVYTVLPSFSFVNEYDLAGEYDALQKQIRLFYDAVDECRKTSALQSCVDSVLNKKEYSSWLDNCETNEEKIFYDFTEIFSQCLNSEDIDCVCTGKLQIDYDAGEYTLTLIQDEENTFFSLLSTDITLTLPLVFEIEDNTHNVITSTEYLIHADRTGTLGSFPSTTPSSEIYLYKKDATTISIEDETTFSTYETTRSSCILPQQEIYKFCMQSDTTISGYDKTQGKTITQPIVYMFAIDFTI